MIRDLDALRQHPALPIVCERLPESDRDIPSQPTISRLENVAHVRALYEIGMGFVDLFCRSYASAPHTSCSISTTPTTWRTASTSWRC